MGQTPNKLFKKKTCLDLFNKLSPYQHYPDNLIDCSVVQSVIETEKATDTNSMTPSPPPKKKKKEGGGRDKKQANKLCISDLLILYFCMLYNCNMHCISFECFNSETVADLRQAVPTYP